MISQLQQKFSTLAGGPGTVFFAPGRINLIGEHTDYSGGFVLPASIELGTWVVAGLRSDDRIRVHSEAQNESLSFSLENLARAEKFHWSNYIKGVAWALRRQGLAVQGADLLVASDLPLGAGLSSSASLEVAVALALLSRIGQSLQPLQLAQLCQSAENDFVGARCGLMDQFAVTHGLREQALLLNCATLQWRTVPMPAGYRWVVANTMVRHSMASGEYNARRAEVEELQKRLRQVFPQYDHLAQLNPEEVLQLSSSLSDCLARRLRHVVSENQRVLEFVSSLERHDMNTVGRLLDASHRSLRDDFEVSCRELDIMVELAGQSPRTLGARMLGGGFGGCVLALVQAPQIESFVGNLQRAYAEATGIDSWIHVCAIEEGARRVA